MGIGELQGLKIEIEPRLAEEAVLRAVGERARAHGAAFRSERDSIYECPDPERKERLFSELHLRWFVRLGLGAPLFRILGENPLIAESAAGCHLIAARTGKEEGADLHGPAGRDGPAPRPMLLIRLLATTLLGPDLEYFLRYELAHVSDMLDPEFGYDPRPDLGVDPPLQSLILSRYRLLWDIRVAGRISRRDRPSGDLEARLRRDFATAFPMLGPRAEEVFRVFLDPPQPAHRELLAFARDPRGAHPPAVRASGPRSERTDSIEERRIRTI